MFRKKINDQKTLFLAGMATLLIANSLQFSLRWTGDRPLVSGAMGVLYGISFGLLLLSIRLKVRRRAGHENPCTSR